MPTLYKHVNGMYRGVLQDILKYGKRISPRGQATYELEGYSTGLLDCRQNLLVSPVRKLNYQFMVAEWAWVMLGYNDTAMIAPYNQRMKEFSDDGLYLRGAYGPKFVEQVPYIIEAFSKDLYTRQAVINIWRDRPGPSKDIPCTLSLQFLYRDNQLNLHVNMRSNDAWLGLPYDTFTFTMLQQYVAMLLGLDPGQYFLHVGSMHLYEHNTEAAQQVADEQIVWEPETPPLTPMPPEFRAMHTGLTLMSRHKEADRDLKVWLQAADFMPQPWYDYLLTMAYKFHKDDRLLPKHFFYLTYGRASP